MTNLQNLSTAQLRQALSIKEKIESLEAELAAMVGEEAPAPATQRGRRGISAAGRARIAAAQRKRWAKANANKGRAKTVGKKRKISAAGRARIAAAARKRWAAVKAAGKNRL